MQGESRTQVKLRFHRVLSLLTVVVGFVLLVGKVYADSEPGAIPLFLLVSGIAWFLITQARTPQ